MVPNQVPAAPRIAKHLAIALRDFTTAVHTMARDEERRANIVSVQFVENHRRGVEVRTVVERERNAWPSKAVSPN